MTYKIVSTVLLVIIASALLISLAFKVKLHASSESSQRFPAATKGCCGNSGGGCAANRQ